MCGIVGYIGSRNPKSVLIEGLKKLEYRGYDSAGMALANQEEIQVIKSVGPVLNLEKKIETIPLLNSHLGIAHTRWATHGEVSEKNAHPHKVEKICLVHNGIIENAEELREQLKKEGISFQSTTDTEVIAALIHYYNEGNVEEAIEKAISRLKGSYALAIMIEGMENLYAVRKDSPLILGIGEKEYFVASDIVAIIQYTNQYILLEDDEIAKVTLHSMEVKKDGIIVEKKILTTDLLKEENNKNGYEHFMLKEMMEEPIVLERTLKPFLEDISILPNLKKYEEIHIVACGSAMYAGMIGKSLLEEKAHIRVVCEYASEYRYKTIQYDRKTLVILISQSGETADTIAAMRKAKENQIDTLAIVNVKTSTIAREADQSLFIEAGSEVAVATTKAYILQVAILALLAYDSAPCNEKEKAEILSEIKTLPTLLKEVLARREEYHRIAKEIYKKEHLFFIGRKIDYAISLEGSLKLKEISYMHSEAYPAGELKHGTISLIEKDTPVIAIVTEEDILEKTISNIEEVKSRGAKVIVVGTQKQCNYDYSITVPKINFFFQPILVVPVLQLLAYEVAKMRGCDIDKPKNLAKSVTVE